MTEITDFERIEWALIDRLREIGAAAIAGELAKKARALVRDSEKVSKKTVQEQQARLAHGLVVCDSNVI